MSGNGEEETCPYTWLTCLHCTDCCSNFVALQKDKVRQNYLMLWSSLVKNGCVTAEHIHLAQKRSNWNFWPLADSANSQISIRSILKNILKDKAVPVSIQGKPLDLSTLLPREKMCGNGKNWNNFYKLRKQFNVEIVTFYIIKYIYTVQIKPLFFLKVKEIINATCQSEVFKHY